MITDKKYYRMRGGSVCEVIGPGFVNVILPIWSASFLVEGINRGIRLVTPSGDPTTWQGGIHGTSLDIVEEIPIGTLLCVNCKICSTERSTQYENSL